MQNMEESELFPGNKTPKNVNVIEKELIEEPLIKKILSFKTNIPQNFVPVLRPQRCSFSSKTIHQFSLDKDDNILSDSEEFEVIETPIKSRGNKEKRRNTFTGFNNKKPSKPSCPHNVIKSKKSLFFTHLSKSQCKKNKNQKEFKDTHQKPTEKSDFYVNNEEININKEKENNENLVETVILI